MKLPARCSAPGRCPPAPFEGPKKFRLLIVTVSLSLYPSALPFVCQKFTWGGLSGVLSQHLAGRRDSEKDCCVVLQFPQVLFLPAFSCTALLSMLI